MKFFIFLVLCLTLGGCPIFGQKSKPGKPTSSLSEKSAPELCAATGGHWKSYLFSCLCPEDLLFSQSRGCVPVCFNNIELPVNQTTALRTTVGSWRVTLESPDPLDRSKRGLERILKPALKRMTLDGLGAAKRLSLFIGPLSHFDSLSVMMHGEFPFDNLTFLPISTGIEMLSSRLTNRCSLLLGSLPEIDEVKLCGDLKQAFEDLSSGLVPLNVSDDSVPGSKRETLVGALTKSGAQGFYNVRLIDGIPLYRMLDLRAGPAQRLVVFLSPSGKIIGGFVSSVSLPAKGEDALLTRSDLRFDGDFLAAGPCSRTSIGDRPGLHLALSQYLDKRSQGRQATGLEGREAVVNEPVNLLMVEAGVDVRAIHLLPQLALREGALLAWAEGRMSSEALLGNGSTPVEQLLALRPDTGEHGLQMATLLLAGLPNARLDLFSPETGGLLGDEKVWQRNFTEAIAASRARVVNISQGFARALPDCESFFGPLVAAHSDQVLFVVSAGNDGSDSPTAACPASLGNRYPNLITVAGTQQNGTLDPSSNRNSDTVDVAAPFCALVPVLEGRGDTTSTAWKKSCGTSTAAARVSNAAAKMFARHPGASPAQVAQKIISTCSGPLLEVACGGEVNFSDMDKNP